MSDVIGSLPGTSAVLAIGTAQTSALDFVGDSDWFQVALTVGTTYVFDLEGYDTLDNLDTTLPDPRLYVYDSSGTVVFAEDDDSGLGLSSRIVFTAAATATYHLSAEQHGHDATGIYTLRANAVPFAGNIAPGGARSGSIESAGDTDWYSVSLSAGMTYVFELAADTLDDPLLELLSETGGVIDFDDDSGPGLNASIVFTPVSSANYYLAARASGNGTTGAYTLTAPLLPSLSIADADSVESVSGAAAVFTVSLSRVLNHDVAVSYTTSNDLAVAGSDYQEASGEIVIPAGSNSATFSVSVSDDPEFEANETFVVWLSNPVNAVIADGTAFGTIEDNDLPPALEVPADEHFAWQWSIFAQYGANVLPVWGDYTGAGVRVAVFDQGIDGSHPDLNGNLLFALNRDAATLAGDGLPEASGDNHGTAVAGVIGAERDGGGIVGIAYGADLVSIYSPLNESVTVFGSRVANAYSYARAVGADVVNDSWGFGNLFLAGANYAFIDDFASPHFEAAARELRDLVALGREGLGTIIVQSAGNSYGYGDDTNLHNFQNSRYIVTVAASDYFGQAADYSSPGASILVTAPGGERSGASGIVSTDRVGAAGYTPTDYGFLAGTSFSAPIISGVVALMLEANPGLGYRDVQEILAYSALSIGADPAAWEFNGAGDWNAGGLHFDAARRQFGFGLVDATAAVRLAETWNEAHTAANLEELVYSRTPRLAISDDSATGAADLIAVAQHLEIERVEVTLAVTHPFIGDLSVSLMSPAGVRSWLLLRPGEGPYSAFGSSQDNIHFTFDTVVNWGEDAAGNWTLSVIDNSPFDEGIFEGWTLTLTGKPASDDDTYIFTNEYAESLATSAVRGALIDAAGVDTLNAAAVSGAVVLNLTPGATSTIDGASLVMDASTVIEHAFGGDGGDAIHGNAAANWLRGMRGSDTVAGASGADTLEGGPGDDALDGGEGIDTAVFAGRRDEYVVGEEAARSVQDTVARRDAGAQLIDIERLQFSDLTLALDTTGNPGSAYALWYAAFDRVPMPADIGRWVAPLDAGQDIIEVARAMIDYYAPGISNRYGVEILYRNVTGMPPGPMEIDYYTGILDRGEMTQAELFVYAAKHELNQADYVGLIASGVSYTPWLA